MPQQPVAELPFRGVERGVGPRPDDAVDEEAALLLERADGGVELVVEDLGGPVDGPVRGGRTQCSRGGEAVAEVADDGSAITETGRRPVRGSVTSLPHGALGRRAGCRSRQAAGGVKLCER